jgi:thymidylate synthase
MMFFTEENKMPTWEQQYLNLIQEIVHNGDDRTDRTGVGTRAIFGPQLDIDLTQGFPALTVKKLAWKAVVSELLWFLEGSSDERRLAEILHGTRDESKKTIWTENAQADYWKPKAKFDGDLGPIYGVQWRSWVGANGNIDQVAAAINKVKNNPTDRRIIVSAWNVAELENVALPACHSWWQLFVGKEKHLSLQLYARSQDVILGTPFNIASYAILLSMIAQVTGCIAHRLIVTMGDAHIYSNHLEAAEELIVRKPFDPPKLILNSAIKDIDSFKMNDFALEGYQSHDPIKLKMAV